ncbi:spermidine synthase [Actinophytocola glycyrrhizae]|uniref:Spermidine synthase n=1 Tax=Actinophytocola glycyrrhizae TaxID=2044873 RepID=A0ABV9S146_9PSEU
MVSEVLARVEGVCGELVLRRVGPHHEIIANGVFLMDTRNGESERLMVAAAADRMPAGATMLIGGLGVGFSLREALDHPRVGSIVVVEREAAVLDWNRTVLGNAGVLADPRVRVVRDDLLAWLPAAGRFGALCLDIDNGPEWTVDDGNASLYGRAGLAMIDDALAPGGVLAVWSAGRAPAFAAALAERYGPVETLEIPVPRGEPDLVFLVTRSRSGSGD